MTFLYVLLIFAFSPGVWLDTIFSDDFNTGYAGWSKSGTVNQIDSDCYTACDAVRLKKDAMIWRAIDTTGYTTVTFSWAMAASSLETPDFCYAQV